MNQLKLQDKFQAFKSDNKNADVCCIDTKIGQIDSTYNTKVSKHTNDLIKRNNGFKNINSQINALFHKRGVPELITMKSEEENKFIKFLTPDVTIFAVVEDSNVNYAKVKIQL